VELESGIVASSADSGGYSRDGALAAVLALASAATVVWQGSRLAVLWDASYVLEHAARIAAGDVPYRDFAFPYAPLTFLVQAAIIRLFGRVYWHHVLYAALACGAATALTYVVVRRFVPRATAFFVTLPLALLGIYCILPHPFYDPDACLAVVALLAAFLAGRRPMLTGALCILPLFIKQNIGLAFVAALVVLLVAERRWRMLAGLALGAAAALALVAAIFGLGNYATWTLTFAAARRLPPASAMLGVYADPIVLWGVAAIAVALIAERLRFLLAAPWLFVLYRFFASDDPNEREINLLRLWPLLLVVAAFAAVAMWRREEPMLRTVPLLVIAAVHGAFLSQQTWGSTYGIWPLLVILLAFVFRVAKAPPLLAAIVAAVMLLSASHYVRTEGRLLYANWQEGELRTSSLPALRGLRMRGEWLPEFEELVHWTDAHVPRSDGILFLPGEDLFYFATGRRPQFPVLMFDRTINPYSPAQIAALAERRGIRWVIVKRRLQLNGTPYPELGDTIHLLSARYRPVSFLRNYVIFRRPDSPIPNRLDGSVGALKRDLSGA
jgi:type IV secretory pathway VirB3-like protein